MNIALNNYIKEVIAPATELIALGLKSEDALEVVSFPSELNALRDTIRQMPTNKLTELINCSKGIPVSISGYKGLFELTGIDPTEGMVFEYSSIHLGSNTLRLPIYELTYNQIQNIWKVIREINEVKH